MKFRVVVLMLFASAILCGSQNVYVSNQQNPGSIIVISNETYQVIATISQNIISPIVLSATPDGTKLYVSDNSTNQIVVINTVTNTVKTVLTTPGGTVQNIVITPDGQKGYVSTTLNTVVILDTVNDLITGTLSVQDGGSYITLSPDGSKLYVPGHGNNTFSVIATANNSTISIMPLPNTPTVVTLTPDGSTAYIGSTGFITALNTNNYAILATFPVTTTAGDLFPAMSPDGTKLYVPGGFSSGNNSLAIINVNTNTIAAILPVQEAKWIAFTPDSSRAFVSTINGLVVINVANNSIITTFPGIATGGTLAITPDGTTLYSVRASAGFIYVMDVANYNIIATIDLTGASLNLNLNTMTILPALPDPSAVQSTVQFLTQSDRFNEVSWSGYFPVASNASGLFITRSNPASYNLFYDSGYTQFAGSAPATGPLGSSGTFYDHYRERGQVYTYYLQAVDKYGFTTNTEAYTTVYP